MSEKERLIKLVESIEDSDKVEYLLYLISSLFKINIEE